MIKKMEQLRNDGVPAKFPETNEYTFEFTGQYK
jgi:hypothetical protein